MNRDDTLWIGTPKRAILEDIFDDFLRFFVPDADQVFDLERGFVFLDKELEQLFPPEDDAYKNRSVDKLVQVYTREGAEKWILVHIEVQGKADPAFGERMFTYFSRIFDKYRRPITAFAILTDGTKSFRPSEYAQSFLGTSLVYRFNSYKILEQPPDDLSKSNNPFAVVALVVQTALKRKKIAEEALLDLKLEVAKALLAKPFPKPKIRQLLNFLRYYVRFNEKDNRVKFDQGVDQFTNRKETVGLEEFLIQRATNEGLEIGIRKGEKIGIRRGLKEGIKEGKIAGIKEGIREGEKKGLDQKAYAVVANLIRQTAFDDEQIAGLTEVTLAFVQQVRREIATQ